MDSLQELLGHYAPQEPPEVLAIKRYVDEHFQTTVAVALQGETIIITARSAALANTLRLQSLKLKAACQTDKRLVFRIS